MLFKIHIETGIIGANQTQHTLTYSEQAIDTNEQLHNLARTASGCNDKFLN